MRIKYKGYMNVVITEIAITWLLTSLFLWGNAGAISKLCWCYTNWASKVCEPVLFRSIPWSCIIHIQIHVIQGPVREFPLGIAHSSLLRAEVLGQVSLRLMWIHVGPPLVSLIFIIHILHSFSSDMPVGGGSNLMSHLVYCGSYC